MLSIQVFQGWTLQKNWIITLNVSFAEIIRFMIHHTELCSGILKEMGELGLVQIDANAAIVIPTGISSYSLVQVLTDLGKLMMKYHLEIQTMRMIWQMAGNETVEQIVSRSFFVELS